ncbi:MAG: pseudouridine synthase [bacterium]
MRLNRFLASLGVGARRKCDELIRQGRVKVNGRSVMEPWFQVEKGRDAVEVDGEYVGARVKLVHILLNKPAGYVVTAADPQNRPTVFDLIGCVEQRVFPVGRLDLDVEGLLLLTNDGDLSYRLTHPRFEVEKVYRVLVTGKPDRRALRSMQTGLQLEDGPTAPTEVRVVRGDGKTTLLELRMHEGRKRQIKRMCKALGHPVIKLVRIAFAGLSINGLHVGEWRYLTSAEVGRLNKCVGLP